MTVAAGPAALPPVRTGLEEAKADLDRYGVTRLSGAAAPADIAEARRRLAEQAAGEERAGIAHRDNGFSPLPAERAANQRVWNLLNKGDIFARFALNDKARALARHMLGKDLLLFSCTANIARRGGLAQRLHADQLFAPAAMSLPLIANSLWMLDDFSEANGATRVAPATHLEGRWPADGEEVETAPATGPAGTLMMWDGRLWHGTGENRTDLPRHGMIIAYCVPFLRPQENHTVSLSPEVLAGASPELLALAGFGQWQGLGMIDGYSDISPQGRPGTYSGILAP